MHSLWDLAAVLMTSDDDDVAFGHSHDELALAQTTEMKMKTETKMEMKMKSIVAGAGFLPAFRAAKIHEKEG